jgi:hypothetical protein
MNTNAITTILAKFHAETKLCDILTEEFETGGTIHNALREAGYTESGMIVINNLSMWNSTVEQLQAFLVKA